MKQVLVVIVLIYSIEENDWLIQGYILQIVIGGDVKLSKVGLFYSNQYVLFLGKLVLLVNYFLYLELFLFFVI